MGQAAEDPGAPSVFVACHGRPDVLSSLCVACASCVRTCVDVTRLCAGTFPKIRSAATKDCPKMNQTTSTTRTLHACQIISSNCIIYTSKRQVCEDPGVPAVCVTYLTRSDSGRTIASPELPVVCLRRVRVLRAGVCGGDALRLCISLGHPECNTFFFFFKHDSRRPALMVDPVVSSPPIPP